ncbi:hypothetical protein LPJ76_000211 [Coemansia sp. RSA 638]|nr:hypothetical protein LPJ76_000211 [Coemansia sp. RSA 638]
MESGLAVACTRDRLDNPVFVIRVRANIARERSIAAIKRFLAPADEIPQGAASVVVYKFNQAPSATPATPVIPASSLFTAPQTYFEEHKSVSSRADSSYNEHEVYGGNDHSAHDRLENGPNAAYDSFIYPSESPNAGYDAPHEGSSKYEHEADGRPSHDAYGKPKYEHGVQDGEYNKPEYDAYDKPKYEHDSYDTSKCEHDTYDKPKYEHGTYDEPKHEHGTYDEPKHEQDTYNEPKHGNYDEPKHEHETYDEPKHEHDAYDKPKYEQNAEHDNYDKPKYEQNAEHDTYDKPKYDDSEYQPPVSDKKHVPALHIGPDPLDQMAPYLVPPSNSPAYHSYHSAIRKQAVLDGIAAELKDAEVIPDILPTTFIPEFELSITFNGLRHPIDMGQLLSINDTEAEPIIEFDAPPGSMFTVAIVDIDSPSNSRHGYRSYRHFLMSNLGLYDDYRGEKLTAYRAPQPSFASGAHRIAVVVLKQTAYVEFTPQDVPHSRVRFDAVKWGAHYHMTPVAASYFMVQRKHAMDFV